MLTTQQRRLHAFIEEFMARTGGVSPSFEEMAAALDLASKSGLHRILSGLEERGYIRRLPSRARALEVLKSSAGAPSLLAASWAQLMAEVERRCGFTDSIEDVLRMHGMLSRTLDRLARTAAAEEQPCP